MRVTGRMPLKSRGHRSISRSVLCVTSIAGIRFPMRSSDFDYVNTTWTYERST
jgi:hypothetical protein